MTREKETKELNYQKLFWVFMIGCIVGVLIEGIFCVIKKGHWESHVVSMFGDFNILYGLSSVLFYTCSVKMREWHLAVKVLVMIVLATILELLSGLILKYGLGMKAWAYTNQVLNYQAIICPKYSLYWGAVGLIFCLLESKLTSLLQLMDGRPWGTICIILSIFMLINLCFTAVSIIRWSERHFDHQPKTEAGRYIDEKYTDEYMKARFMDWRFYKFERDGYEKEK